MGKTALVLSGGGARGAYEAEVVRYAMEVKGYKFDVISGVSVGALNGAMIAMHKLDRLTELWRTLTPEMIYTGPTASWRTVVKLLMGSKSVYDTTPLRELIDREIDPSQITDVDLRIGAVSLKKRKYFVFRPSHPDFKKALLASAAIPTLFPPVEISEEYPAMADGSIKNYAPIGDIMDTEPDEIVIISCRPRVMSELPEGPKNALRVGQEAFEIATHQMFLNDLQKFLSKNRTAESTSWMVEQLLEAGRPIPDHIILRNARGRVYRYVRAHIIEPTVELGAATDFKREHIDRCRQAGWEDAKKAFGD